jgi:hypothetical protein
MCPRAIVRPDRRSATAGAITWSPADAEGRTPYCFWPSCF